jgi:hypothetical protein
MRVRTERATARRLIQLLVAGTLAVTATIAGAQNTAQPAPARETPRPEDIDPAVNTSETPPASARETPRPEDIDPAVNTSPRTPAPSEASRGSSQPQSAPPPSDAQGARPAAGAAASRGRALDRLELDTTQITGNRELPKVLYIVPWKRSDLGDLVGKPVNSLLDEVLTPVDRDVFKRENRYYRALTPGAAENDALSANDVKRPFPVRETPASAPPGAGSPGSATSAPTKPAAGGGSAAGNDPSRRQ